MEYLRKQRDPQGGGQIVLALGDLVCIAIASLIAIWIDVGSWPGAQWEAQLAEAKTRFGLGAGLFFGLALYFGVYNNSLVLRWRECARRIFHVAVSWGVIQCLLALLGVDSSVSIGMTVINAGLLLGLLLVWRIAVQKNLFSRYECFRQRLLILGGDEEVEEMVEVFSGSEKEPYLLCGLICSSGGETARVKEAVACVGGEFPIYDGLQSLETAVRETNAQGLLLMDPGFSRDEILEVSEFCIRSNVDFKLRTTAFEILSSLLAVEMVGGTPVLGRKEVPVNLVFSRILKRVLDLLIAIPLLILTVPVMVFFGILINREDPGDVLFRQRRVGVKGAEFTMLKLRSMKLGSEKEDHRSVGTSGDDSRLLAVGRAMRRWSIDELPQLWNVVRGSMSLVGPRPERTHHVESLAQEITHFGFRHLVKPGITGWAQVNNLRGECDFSERAKFDLYYIENWSLLLDLQILALTLFRLKDDTY